MPTADAGSRASRNLRRERVKSYELVQDGKVLLDAGKLDEAEAHFKAAMQMYPQNTAASYYLEHFQARHGTKLTPAGAARGTKQEVEDVEQAWLQSSARDLLPVPNMYARTNLVYTSDGRRMIKAKLDRIRLQEISFDGLPLVEVLKKLTEESIKRDPDRLGINFMYNSSGDQPPGLDGSGGSSRHFGGPRNRPDQNQPGAAGHQAGQCAGRDLSGGRPTDRRTTSRITGGESHSPGGRKRRKPRSPGTFRVNPDTRSWQRLCRVFPDDQS